MSDLFGIGAIHSANMSFLGGLVGLAANAASSKRQYHWQRDLMELQGELNYKYGRKSAINQYTWQRKGLEKAGYNPLLALGGAEGVANTGWTSSQSAPDPGYGESVSSALQFAENYRQNKLANSQIGLNTANADTAKANQSLISQEIVGKALENSYFSRQKDSEIALNNAEQFYKLSLMQNELKKYQWFDRKTEAEIYQMLGTTKASLMQGQASITSANAQRLQANIADYLAPGINKLNRAQAEKINSSKLPENIKNILIGLGAVGFAIFTRNPNNAKAIIQEVSPIIKANPLSINMPLK